jgi:BlaI family transcriptional regulator, penicillinase repressor
MDEFLVGERELDVMAVLWELGSGTVTEVRDKLPVDLAYTTVLTILRNLEEKQFVTHKAEGRAHRYFPKVARNAAQKTVVARLVDKLFQGSSEQLIAHIVEGESLTAEELKRLRAQLAAQAERPSRAKRRKS